VRVYLRTFGCRANHYDTEAVRAMVESGGHTVAASVDDADVAVFNSCAVTSEAEAELRKVVRRAGRRRPELRSVVIGCAAALDNQRPIALRLRSLPTVERVIGGADLPSIAAALDLPLPRSNELTRHQTGTRALLRIQDGCDEHCTFCATTMARGANRSRLPDDVVHEAGVLAERHSEIVITGIHIGTYGADIDSSIGALMTRLVRDVPGARFRLSSIEATEIGDDLAELITDPSASVAPHLHAPLQSGSDRLLRRMGRHWYAAATYARAIERIAARLNVFGLGADVIAGFPGETEEDHAATIALVEQLPFTYLHVFPFSLRPGTAAERLPDRASPVNADRRARELRAVAERKNRRYTAGRAGGHADVIAIGRAETQGREGLTEDFLTVRLGDATLPRGARFDAHLEYDANCLTAVATGADRALPFSVRGTDVPPSSSLDAW
jgi:threonylcarbamoyladenosine tRNA methylthiotransferase MtaB